MISFKLDERMDEIRDRTGKRPTFKEISKATDVSVSVLSNMRVKPGYNTSMDHIDALCEYFQCQPGDLLVWKPGRPKKRGKKVIDKAEG